MRRGRPTMQRATRALKSLPTESLRSSISAAVVFAALLTLIPTLASAQTLSQITFKGATSPDGVSAYRSLHRPHVGDALGQAITFLGKTRNLSTGSSRGVFIEDEFADGSIVAQSDDPAPTLPVSFFRRFEHPTINGAGNVAFRASTDSTTYGIYRSLPLAPVSLAADLPPVPLAGQINQFGPPGYTDSQGMIFRITLFGAASVSTPAGSVALDQAIVRCHLGDQNCHNGTGVFETLLTKNDPVPDRPGRFFCQLPEEVGVSDYGIAFRAPTKLDCGDLVEEPVYGMFRFPFGGAIETVAFVGEPAVVPTLAGMSYLRLDGIPQIDVTGRLAFAGRTNGAVKEDDVFSCVPAQPCIAVVREAVSVGGTNISLSRFKGVDIADGGDIVFQAVVNQQGYFTGINRGIGVYIYRVLSGTLERVAVKGDAAPDTLPATFRRIYLPDSSPGGRVAFRGKAKRANGGGGIIAMFLYE